MALRRHHHFKSMSSGAFIPIFLGFCSFIIVSLIYSAWFSVAVGLLGLLIIIGIRMYSIHPDFKTMEYWDALLNRHDITWWD